MSDKPRIQAIFHNDVTLITLNGDTHLIGKSHRCYQEIKEAVKSNDYELLERLLNVDKMLEYILKGVLDYSDDTIYANGKSAPDFIIKYVIENGESKKERIHDFLRLIQGRIVDKSLTEIQAESLWQFLDVDKLPISSTGFKAVKAVRKDNYDEHSKSVLYQVGEHVEIADGKYDTRFESVCVPGLHFGTASYASSYIHNGKYLLLEIKLEDLLGVGEEKGRCKKCYVEKEIDIIEDKPIIKP